MTIISKSSYIRGIKCPKALYLHFNHDELRDETDAQQENIFNIGHSVGHYAQQLFPGGIDASRGNPQEIAAAVDYTRELIARGQEVIYEAAFGDGETLCYMDILVKRDGRWYAYECKASTQVKDYYLDDISFQYYVITRSGLPLAGIYLLHLNNRYVRRGELDLEKLFIAEDLTETALLKQDAIPANLRMLQLMLESGIIPEAVAGRQCSHPYECDFNGYCHQDAETYPLCDVQGIKQENYNAGHTTL